jgi:NTP pyrophosphatase (non-canonical NTP hydrolase)
MTKELKFSEYQELANRSAGAGGRGKQRLIVSALGLAGEAGEFANLVKKMTAHGHPFDKAALEDELGDVLWYLAEAATAAGLDLNQIGNQNVEKLIQRYPDGFSQKDSINRQQ